MLRYHVIILIDSADHDLFHKLCLSQHSVHHSLQAVQKCNNLRDHGHPYELNQICGRRTAMT